MATNNDFISLDVPSVPGTGAASDVSDMGFGLSLAVEGPPTSIGEIVIEASQNGTSFAPVTAVFSLNNPPAVRLAIVAKKVRVVRFTGTGPASVSVGAPKTSLNLFGTLSLSPLNTSEMGPFKTIVLVGEYVSPIVIEGSTDGSSYVAVASFDTQGSDVISTEGTWATMRVRPNTDLTGISVAVGTGFAAGSVGSGGGPLVLSDIIVTTHAPTDGGQNQNVEIQLKDQNGADLSGIRMFIVWMSTNPLGPLVPAFRFGFGAVAGTLISGVGPVSTSTTNPVQQYPADAFLDAQVPMTIWLTDVNGHAIIDCNIQDATFNGFCNISCEGVVRASTAITLTNG